MVAREEEVEYFGSPLPRKLSQRQIASRNAVLVAAADAFIKRGYAATSIDDIADRLGATKGRIYHYFRTKGEIFVGIHQRALEMATESVLSHATSSGSPAARLKAMATAHAALMMNETGFMRLAVQHVEMELASEGRTRKDDIDEIYKSRRAYEGFFAKVIQEGIDAGEFNTADAGLMAKAVLGPLNWMSVWYNPRRDDDPHRKDEIAEALATFVIAGLNPSAAAKRRSAGSA